MVWGVALVAATPESQYAPPNRLFDVVKYSFVGYYVLVYFAIWNAATKYTGPRVWSILAKFVVVITCVPIAIRLIQQYGSVQ